MIIDVETDDIYFEGDHCYGYYDCIEQVMYVATMVPFEELFKTMAHEYMHHLQNVNNRELNEEEAERYAEERWNEYVTHME